ncbi:MAG: Fic family protein [Spirochaetales bacterium]|nr:Fic family protein [Spirochaetales bacterium]
MNEGQIQAFMDFLRFSLEAEGAQMTESQDEQLRMVLDGELNPDEAVQEIVDELGLDDAFKPSGDEDGRYPGTKCLVNFFNIRDREKLKAVESRIVPIRMAQLLAGELPVKFDFNLLREIHSALFSDIYPSAGEIRHFGASKRTSFCRPEYIQDMADNIFGKLLADRYLTDRDEESFINDLAFYMGEVQALHPFFDGNGRSARAFFYLLILNAGYDMKWYEIDPDRLLEADISAITGEYQLLIDVLSEAVVS